METEPDSYLCCISLLFIALPPTEVVIGLSGILLLLISSALISGSEVAFFSLTPGDFDKLSDEDDPGSKRILSLKDRPRRLLATILISNNFVNIAIVILSEFVLRNLLGEQTFLNWANGLARIFPISAAAGELLAGILGIAVTVVLVTFLLVLFGEVAPKVYATNNKVRLAKFMSGPLIFLMWLFGPLSHLLVGSGRLLEKRLARLSFNVRVDSKQDIDEAIELTVNKEENTEQEIDILKSIVKFSDMTVRQIMTARVDVIAVDEKSDYAELMEIARESGYSRIPVYESDLDNIKGILYVKDLLGHLNEPANFNWQMLIRSNVLYVPEAKKISDLLKEFQRAHLHMAIVVDEYGGTSGLVTLEDIMEEIIGDIKDEFDDEAEVVFRKIDDYNYLFEGKTLLNDVYRVTGIEAGIFDEVRGETDSLAGLMLELYGQLPKKDTEITFYAFRFKIVAASKRRIEQVLITLPK
ncbi:MAG TPA: gliding motility-associated protein GldE [Saprospiraceae bacterium]|nr:gliding motility-associated protein GldE [Saprospiraceae bacterium]HMP22612.1 gliding motility-associated protein GldE [Saprospiraceae bacterium]